MATYKYTAISKDGVKVSGVVEGFNEFDAVDRIKQDCDIVLKLTEVEEKKPGLLSMERWQPPERQSFFPDVRPVFHYPPVRNSHWPYRPADRRQNDRQKAERYFEKSSRGC